MNKLFRFFVLLVLIPLFLFAYGADRLQWPLLAQSPTDRMIGPGDKIDNMILTTGADEAPPLWAFCSRSAEGEGRHILDCRTPVLASLGIGNIFLDTDEAIANLDWADLNWKLSIDGQEVDLESFGTVDYVMPRISKKPSPVREIFKQGTAWDIVLTDLKPGHHTLWFVAQSDNERHTWFVNLEIEPKEDTARSSVPFPLHS